MLLKDMVKYISWKWDRSVFLKIKNTSDLGRDVNMQKMSNLRATEAKW